MAEKLDPAVAVAAASEPESEPEVENLAVEARVFRTINRGQNRRVQQDITDLREALRTSSLYFTIPRLSPEIEAVHKDVVRTPLNELERISLEELLDWKTSSEGLHLLLRTLEPAYCDRCIATVVEDHEGNAVTFAWYNFTVDFTADIHDLLPVGIVFALKWPSCLMTDEGNYLLQCECPSDVVFLYNGHVLFELAEDVSWQNEITDPLSEDPEQNTARGWKLNGDIMFKSGQFHLAIKCYFLALKKIEEFGDQERQVQAVQLRMSRAHMKRGYYEASVEFADKVLKVDPQDKKALLTAGRSCYMLRKYKDALKYYEVCHGLNAEDCEIKEELNNIKERIEEQETGQYAVQELLAIRIRRPRRLMDCADYVGPVKLVDIKGRGRGVVATSDIAPGTLLVVSKALSFAWDPPKSLTEKRDVGSWEHLIVQLGEMIFKNPRTFGPIIYDLDAGRDLPREQPPRVFCDAEDQEEPIVDLKRLKAIVSVNVLGNGPTAGQYKTCLKRSHVYREGCGLFQWLSYFNHNCLPNTSMNEFNDVVFIRAISHIKAGEEVFVSYVSWELPLPVRINVCKKIGFMCTCLLCFVDSQVSIEALAERAKLLFLYECTYTSVCINQKRHIRNLFLRIWRMINQYQLTYQKDEPKHWRVALSPFYNLLCDAYALEKSNYKFECEIEGRKMVLKYMGFDPVYLLNSVDKGNDLVVENAVLDSSVLYAVYRLIPLHFSINLHTTAFKWYRVLLALENIYSGGDVNMVRLQYPYVRYLLDEKILF